MIRKRISLNMHSDNWYSHAKADRDEDSNSLMMGHALALQKVRWRKSAMTLKLSLRCAVSTQHFLKVIALGGKALEKNTRNLSVFLPRSLSSSMAMMRHVSLEMLAAK